MESVSVFIGKVSEIRKSDKNPLTNFIIDNSQTFFEYLCVSFVKEHFVGGLEFIPYCRCRNWPIMDFNLTFLLIDSSTIFLILLYVP